MNFNYDFAILYIQKLSLAYKNMSEIMMVKLQSLANQNLILDLPH